VASSPVRPSAAQGELWMAVGVVAYGLFLMVETWAIPVSPGYAQIGPRVFPWVISGALIVLGGVLVGEALSGRWTYEEGEEPGEFHRAPFFWLVIGFALYLATVQSAGFPIASALLFAAAARAFGSRRTALDLIIGLVLAVVVFEGFNRGLGLSLPGGWLDRVL
jgi:putative tricarboxylic transport membrane protein